MAGSIEGKRIVVVGTGMGGSSVSALLAKEGAEVTVLERNSYPGGKAASFEREGFIYDTGVHWLARGNKGPMGEVASIVGTEIEFVTLNTAMEFTTGGTDRHYRPGHGRRRIPGQALRGDRSAAGEPRGGQGPFQGPGARAHAGGAGGAGRGVLRRVHRAFRRRRAAQPLAGRLHRHVHVHLPQGRFRGRIHLLFLYPEQAEKPLLPSGRHASRAHGLPGCPAVPGGRAALLHPGGADRYRGWQGPGCRGGRVHTGRHRHQQQRHQGDRRPGRAAQFPR